MAIKLDVEIKRKSKMFSNSLSRQFFGWNRPGRLARVGIAYSTKDRVELSRRTVETALGEPDSDGHWMDGSATEQGRSLPEQYFENIQNIKEIHYRVTGGPDSAIVYSLRYLLDKGYEYVCLVENDVLLERGWLSKTLELFEIGRKKGLRVGAASARTFDRRILYEFDNHAVMFNLGAGMILLSRDAAEIILSMYRTTTFGEVATIVSWFTGRDITTSWELRHIVSDERSAESGFFHKYLTSTDWLYDCTLLLSGYVSMATIPSLARNIDGDLSKSFGIREVRSGDSKSGLPVEDFVEFVKKHHSSLDGSMSHYARYCRCPQSGRSIYFPQQIIWHGSGSVSGTFKLRWEQGFGPFNCELEKMGSKITFLLNGGQNRILFRTGPQAGRCRISTGDATFEVDLRSEHDGFKAFTIDRPYQAVDHITLEALTPNVTWRGIESNVQQPDLMNELGRAKI